MAEWTKAPALKAVDPQGSVGSNPTRSAVDEATLRQLLDAVIAGEVAPDDAVDRLRRLPWADLGFARVDHHRALRGGPEVVYGPGKTPAEAARIVASLLAQDASPVLVTKERWPSGRRQRS